MSNKPTKKTTAVSGDTENADDVNNRRSAVELHRQTDALCAVYDCETTSLESNRSEIESSEHYTPSEIEELREKYDIHNVTLMTDTGADDVQKDIQDVFEKEDDEDFNPFLLAAELGDSETVRRLLHIHDVRQAGETPFYLLAKSGHADVLDLLLRRGICDFVATSYNETPLHIAVKERHTKVVEVILKHSCRISGKLTKDEQKLQENVLNFIETRGSMPIELMKSDGRRVSAEIVWVEKSTPLEIMIESSGYTALELAVRSIQPDMVRLLLNVDQCVYSEKHLEKSFSCMIETIKFPTDYQNEVISKMKHRNVKEITDHEMTCKNIKEIAHVLMTSSQFNVNHQNDQLMTPLHKVINHCNNCFYDYLNKKSTCQHLAIQTIDDVIQLLLSEKGADFNMKNAFGQTPLIIASERGCCHTIQILFDWEHKSGVKLNLDARDQYGATALIKAAEMRHVSVMQLLLNHKVSVNLHDNYGFTALHASVYEPNRNWFDLHFFCEGLRKREFDIDYIDECRKISRWKWHTVDIDETVDRLEEILEHHKTTTPFKEDTVKLLMAIVETNVNAIDFRGNTPLDLAVKSSMRITSATFKALKSRGAIRKTLEPEDEAPIQEARVDERGRSPLHRLIISHVSNYAVEDMKAALGEQDYWRFDLMIHGILLKPENFRQQVAATDDKGRTPLHYAVMQPDNSRQDSDLVRVLLELGSNVNAADLYGKTPLHYSEMNHQYELLVKYGADENKKDKHGHTPRDLKQLRESMTIITDNTQKLRIGKQVLCTYTDITLVLNTVHVKELSKRKVIETVRIYSQSHRPKESSEEEIWNVWMQNDLTRLNRRVSQLRPSIQRLIERLADGMKEKDGRFESQPILVGSADEETKAFNSADFDFNFKLIKFSQLCDVFPHPVGPKGYFQLRLKQCDNIKRRQSDEQFTCFFNSDQCLLTNELNSRFQIVLEEVINDPNFWQDEHHFEWNLTYRNTSKRTVGLYKTVELRMINPIADGEGGFIFVNVSIDVVACVHVEDSWLGDHIPDALGPDVKADGCTLVFDQPRFDPSKSPGTYSIFSDTFARISFAPLESRIVRESSSLIKAAYIVCKSILYDQPATTYQLKTSLLFCMEALKVRKGSETKDEDKITSKELSYWVERLMFCFTEFYRHDVFPCYFMPSFRQRVVRMIDYFESLRLSEADKVYVSARYRIPFQYSLAFDIYLDLCPDDTPIDIPIIQKKYTYDITEGSRNANQDPMLEQFDREEFIRKLSYV